MHCVNVFVRFEWHSLLPRNHLKTRSKLPEKKSLGQIRKTKEVNKAGIEIPHPH
jgi:hypothetical protein